MSKGSKIKSVAVFTLFLISSSGCAIGLGKSLHEYSMLEAPIDTKNAKQRPVSVEANQNVILGFSFNTDFADEAYQNLLNSCPNGRIINVSARHSTDLGFLAYKNKMVLTGTCLE